MEAWSAFQKRTVFPEKGVPFRTLAVWAAPDRPPKAAKAKQRAAVMVRLMPDWTVKAMPEVISRRPDTSTLRKGTGHRFLKKQDSMVKNIR